MIYKTLDQAEAFETLQTLPAGAPALIHWRMATHGSRTKDNCHPFAFRTRKARKRLWVGAHNGVLTRQACLPDKTDSESFMVSLDRIHPREIEQRINSLGYGKMAFLSESGELVLCNAHQGSWRVADQVWQSNTSLDPAKAFYGGLYGGYWDSEDGWRPAGATYGKRSGRWTQATCEWCGEDRPTTLWQSEEGDMICQGCKEHEERFETEEVAK